jgi:hypothetical protein
MRLPGAEPDCGPLLELDLIRRQLRLGSPVIEGVETIAVAQIIGTTGRVRDFDGCFRPLRRDLQKRIDEIRQAAPPALDEAIEVVRIDRAYFVSDGHKRVALARRTGREFIDARVSHLPTPYALSPDVELDAIERTAREGEFRRHSGLAEAVPDARFALTDVSGYGELLLAVQSFSFDRVQALGRMLSAADGARHWYEHRYLPGVARGREAVGGLLDACTDADVFLMLHRHERGAWGSTCDEPECVADMLLAEQRRTASDHRSALDRVLGRDTRQPETPALLLPLADADEHAPTDS